MREEFQERTRSYLESLYAADPAEVPALRAEYSKWYYSLTDSEREEIESYAEKNRPRETLSFEELQKMFNEVLAMEEKAKRKKRAKVPA